MRVIDCEHLGNPRVIACFEVDGVLVDPGPESTVRTLLAGLGEGFEPRAILLTHIHFDHAGATGALIERSPDVPVYVHEVGAPHLVRPERLVKSATRLYGEEDMKRLWGEVVPVPEANVHVLTDGGDAFEDWTYAYTPGHASHHVSYLHDGVAFTGDVAGARIPPSELVVAPTPPPDVDVDGWRQSLDTVSGWAPTTLAITHFGLHEDVERHLDACRTALDEEIERVGRLTEAEFVASQTAYYEERTDLGTAETYTQAVPHHHIWLGLHRWLEKHG